MKCNKGIFILFQIFFYLSFYYILIKNKNIKKLNLFKKIIFKNNVIYNLKIDLCFRKVDNFVYNFISLFIFFIYFTKFLY